MARIQHDMGTGESLNGSLTSLSKVCLYVMCVVGKGASPDGEDSI